MCGAPYNPYRELSRQASRRRRIALGIILTSATLIALLSLADHAGLGFGHRSPLIDLRRYDQLAISGAQAASPNQVRLPDGTIVAILGTLPPRRAADRRAALAALQELVDGKTLLLRLEPASTRTSDGILQAHIFINDHSLAPDLLRQGLVLFDRQTQSAYRSILQQSEAQARKKKLGLWSRPAATRN